MATLTADQVVVEVLARTDQTKRQVTAYADSFERDMNRTKVASDRADQAVVRSSQVQRAAYQQLGFQLSDVVAQASNGTSAFVILAQQGGQTAAALSGFGGVVGRVATFMSGPFGAAILGAVTVMGLLATRSGEGATAHRKQGDAAKSLQDAIEDLDAASGIAAKTEEGRKRAALATARALVEQEIRTRNLTKAELDRQIALLGAASIGATSGEPGAEGISAVLPALEARVVALQRLVDDQDDKIRTAKDRIGLDEGYFRAVQGAEAATSASARLEQQLDRERDAAIARYEVTKDDAALQATLTSIEQRRIAAAAAAGNARRAASAERKIERDAAREAAEAERDYWSTVKAGNSALDDAAAAGQRFVDERLRQAAELDDKINPSVASQADDLIKAGDRAFDERMAGVTDGIEEANAAANDLKRDLASGITDAITGAGNLGDALENAFVRAGIAAFESQIFDLLGSAGGGFFSLAGNFLSGRPGRASGGHVSAGKLYRVNERGGDVEGFQPAGSGKIIPLGRMRAAAGGGAVTNVSLTIPVDARGANDPQFTARVAQDAIRQAAPQIIETTLRAMPNRLSSSQTYEG